MKETISPAQMASLLLAFTTGSSIVYIPSVVIASAGTGAWLSMLVSGAAGTIILTCVLFLHGRYPEVTLIQYYRAIFGRWIALPLSAWFILVMVLMIANITAGLGNFFTSTMMVDTPVYTFHLLILIAAAMTASAGIEVAARLFILLLAMIFGMIAFILFAIVPQYDPARLLPQMNEGLRPMLHGAYIAFGFPFSEVFVFAALLRHVRVAAGESFVRYMNYAMLILIATFTVVALCATMVFGPIAGLRNYTLYEMARMIEIGGILERVESVAGITLIASSYIKTTIAMLALNAAVTHFFRLPDRRTSVYPLALMIFFLSLMMFYSLMEAIEFWTVLWPMITFSCAAPVIAAAAVELIRHPRGGGS